MTRVHYWFRTPYSQAISSKFQMAKWRWFKSKMLLFFFLSFDQTTYTCLLIYYNCSTTTIVTKLTDCWTYCLVGVMLVERQEFLKQEKIYLFPSELYCKQTYWWMFQLLAVKGYKHSSGKADRPNPGSNPLQVTFHNFKLWFVHTVWSLCS